MLEIVSYIVQKISTCCKLHGLDLSLLLHCATLKWRNQEIIVGVEKLLLVFLFDERRRRTKK